MRCCCYCLTVKQGSYLAAVWSTVYSSLQLGDIIHEEYKHSVLISKSEQEKVLYRESIINPGGWRPGELTAMYTLLLTTYILVLLSLPFLLVGLKKAIGHCLLPWIISTALATLSESAINIYIIAFKQVRFEPLTAFVFTTVFFLLMIQVYSILCVLSQYRNSKEGMESLLQDVEVEPSSEFAVTGIFREKEQFLEQNQLSRISEEDEKSSEEADHKTSDGQGSDDSPLTISANIETIGNCDNTDSDEDKETKLRKSVESADTPPRTEDREMEEVIKFPAGNNFTRKIRSKFNPGSGITRNLSFIQQSEQNKIHETIV